MQLTIEYYAFNLIQFRKSKLNESNFFFLVLKKV
jgi:hypothetical protein